MWDELSVSRGRSSSCARLIAVTGIGELEFRPFTWPEIEYAEFSEEGFADGELRKFQLFFLCQLSSAILAQLQHSPNHKESVRQSFPFVQQAECGQMGEKIGTLPAFGRFPGAVYRGCAAAHTPKSRTP